VNLEMRKKKKTPLTVMKCLTTMLSFGTFYTMKWNLKEIITKIDTSLEKGRMYERLSERKDFRFFNL